MASNFDHCFRELIEIEGEWANHTNDYGKRTRWGISERFNPEVDLDSLTIESTKQWYRDNYWLPLHCHEIIDDDVAFEIFEQAVNFGGKHGRGGGVRNVQRALNYLGESLVEDAWMGKRTITSLNYWTGRDKALVLKVLNGVQFAEYLEAVRSDSSQKAFARGWLKRVQI